MTWAKRQLETNTLMPTIFCAIRETNTGVTKAARRKICAQVNSMHCNGINNIAERDRTLDDIVDTTDSMGAII